MMYLYFIKQSNGSYEAVSSEELIDTIPFEIIRVKSTDKRIDQILNLIDSTEGALSSWRSVMLVLSKFCN